jgi:hypothetical protein
MNSAISGGKLEVAPVTTVIVAHDHQESNSRPVEVTGFELPVFNLWLVPRPD